MVGVTDGVVVFVGVVVTVGVAVEVLVAVGVTVDVGVCVGVLVGVIVGVTVFVGVGVGVGVGATMVVLSGKEYLMTLLIKQQFLPPILNDILLPILFSRSGIRIFNL